MLALKLTDTKDFMNKLLKSPLFDHFLLQSAEIASGASYTIDGQINHEFYTESEREELGLSDCRFLPFSMLRGSCFDLIKGKKAPSSFKFVFLLSPENLRRTLERISGSFTENDVTGMFLNIRFQNELLRMTTGVSYRIFSADKSLEHEWDHMVKQFLSMHEITFEEL